VRKLAYLHVVEPSDPRGDPNDRLIDPILLRQAFRGPYIGNGSYLGERARAALVEGRLDAVSIGRPFIANPDLPRRLAEGLPLNALDPERIYGGDGDGYTDYPTFDESSL
jgi:N-ethylmaleimide reductase